MSKLDEIVYSHIGADVTTFNGVKVVNLSDHRVPSEQVKENIKKLMLELVENTYTIYSDTLEGEALDKDELINRIVEL